MDWQDALKNSPIQFTPKAPRPIIVRNVREGGVQERIIHIGPDRFAYWIGLPGVIEMQETYARFRMTRKELAAYLKEHQLEQGWEEQSK